MNLNNRKGQFFFKLDHTDYSCYNTDGEIILWDGLPYIVCDVSEETIDAG